MAFGFGKKWWKRMSGLSNAQRKVSRAIGVPLSGRKSVKITNPLAWLFGGSGKAKGNDKQPNKQAQDAADAKENEKKRKQGELEKQAEDAAIAKENEQQRKRDLKRQAEDAAQAREIKIRDLKEEIKEATRLRDERRDAWKQAGSPEIQQQAMDEAKERANDFLTLLRGANRENAIASVKIGYLRLAYFIRKTASNFGMPWFVIATIIGAVFFTFAVLLALFVTNSLVATFALVLQRWLTKHDERNFNMNNELRLFGVQA